MKVSLAFKTAAASVVLMLTGLGAQAQDGFPNKIVTIVVPFPAGGSTDLLARLVADELGKEWGKEVIVENRVGGKSTLGVLNVVKSAPDGHTMLLTTNSIALDRALRPENLPYSLEKDLLPLTNVGATPFLFVVNNDVPVKDVKELVTYAKENPGKLTYSTAGVGATNHMVGERFEYLEKIDMTDIPYKGAVEALGDLMGNRIQASWVLEANVAALLRENKLKALGIASGERSKGFPEVPTLTESGLEGWGSKGLHQWYGIFLPKATPPELIEKVQSAMLTVLHKPDVIERIRGIGIEPIGSSSTEFSAEVDDVVNQWAEVIAHQKIKIAE